MVECQLMSALGHSLRSYSASGRPFVRCWSNSVLDFAVQRAQRSAISDHMSARRHMVANGTSMRSLNRKIQDAIGPTTDKGPPGGRIAPQRMTQSGHELAFNHPLQKNRLVVRCSKDPSVEDPTICLLYTSDAADDLTRVDLGGR